MRMKPLIVQHTVGALLALVVLATPHTAYSQQMNFSYYTDTAIGNNGQTYYTTISGSDNSSGCTHWDYQTTGYVSGASGYYEQSFSGLTSYIDVPFASGNFTIASNATVSCSCFGSGLGAGGGYTSTQLGNFEANYYYDYTYLGLWKYERCASGICQTMYLVPSGGSPPLYRRLTIFWELSGGIRKCFNFGATTISSCAG
jgi:hypothetical protein